MAALFHSLLFLSSVSLSLNRLALFLCDVLSHFLRRLSLPGDMISIPRPRTQLRAQANLGSEQQALKHWSSVNRLLRLR